MNKKSSKILSSEEAKLVYEVDVNVDELENRTTHVNIIDQYRTETGQTCLMWAARLGHMDCLVTLLNSRAAVNIQDDLGYTSLMLAAWYSHYDCVSTLIERNAAINLPSDNGMTALHCAADGNSAESIKRLLKHGAMPSIIDSFGRKPIDLLKEKKGKAYDLLKEAMKEE